MVLSGLVGLPTPGVDTPVASSWFNAQNRINSWVYDGMGNLTANAMTNPSRTFVYAENRQVQATLNGVTSSYTYDGDGRRVARVARGTWARGTARGTARGGTWGHVGQTDATR